MSGAEGAPSELSAESTECRAEISCPDGTLSLGLDTASTLVLQCSTARHLSGFHPTVELGATSLWDARRVNASWSTFTSGAYVALRVAAEGTVRAVREDARRSSKVATLVVVTTCQVRDVREVVIWCELRPDRVPDDYDAVLHCAPFDCDLREAGFPEEDLTFVEGLLAAPRARSFAVLEAARQLGCTSLLSLLSFVLARSLFAGTRWEICNRLGLTNDEKLSDDMLAAQGELM